MRKKKKQLPLAVIKAFEVFKDLDDSIFELDTTKKDVLLEVRDKDPNSDFRFSVLSHSRQPSGRNVLVTERTPQSEFNSSPIKVEYDNLQLFGQRFKEWVEIVKGYNQTDSVFDDPILKAYADEYYESFTMADPDGDKLPFNSAQVLLLEGMFNGMKERLLHDENVNESNQDKVDDVVAQIDFIKGNLTQKSKNWVIKQTSQVAAKLTKLGLAFVKNFIRVGGDEIMRKAIYKVYDVGSKIFIDLIE